jgi:hypothetical protein
MHVVNFVNFAGELITKRFVTLAEAVKLITVLKQLSLSPVHFFEE